MQVSICLIGRLTSYRYAGRAGLNSSRMFRIARRCDNALFLEDLAVFPIGRRDVPINIEVQQVNPVRLNR